MAVLIKVDIESTSDEEAPASWANQLDMSATFTTITGKIYLLRYDAVCVYTSTDETGEWRFAVDGTPIGAIGTAFVDSGNVGQGVSLMFAWVEISGQSRTFSVQWQIVTGTPRTDTTRTRSFQVLELDDAALKLDLSSTASDTPTSSYTDVVGLSGSFETASGAKHLIIATMPTEMGSDRSADFRFHVDTAAEGPEVSSWDDATNEGSSIQLSHYRVGLSAASHTFALRWKDRQGSPAADTGRTRILQVLELTGGWDIRVNVASQSSQDATGSFVIIENLAGTFTPQGTDSVMLMLLNMVADGSNNPDEDANYRLTIAGSQVGAETRRANDETSGVHGLHLAHAETGRSTSQEYAGQWQLNTNTPTTDTARPRQIQVLEWSAPGGAALVKVDDDTENIAEGVLQKIEIITVEDETEQVSEGTLRALTLVREIGETENIVEATLRVMDLVRLLDETENIAEGVLQRIATVVETGEVEQISEASLRLLGIVLEDADTENIAEAVLQRIATVILADEAENVTEGVLRALTLVRLVGETEQVSEGALRALVLVRLVGDAENIGEATLRVMAQVRVDGDVEQVAEQVNRALATVVEDGDVENIGEGVLKILVRPPLNKVVDETEEIGEQVFALVESAHLVNRTRAFATHTERTVEPD